MSEISLQLKNIDLCQQDLVGEALVRLGYSSDLIPSARGSIVIRNWKPLPMEKVADGPLLTVGDILAELTSVATLKIQVYRSRPPPPSPAAEVRNKLLRLLLLHSHTLLVSAGCPLDEVRRFALSRLCIIVFDLIFDQLNTFCVENIILQSVFLKIYIAFLLHLDVIWSENAVRKEKNKYMKALCKVAFIWRRQG